MRFRPLGRGCHVATDNLGVARFFGVPFALASLMPLSGALGLVEFQMEGGGEAPRVFLFLFALPFLGIGLGLLCWRREVRIDLSRGVVTRTSRVLVRLGATQRPLERFVVAAHGKRVIRGSKSSRTVYPVTLETDGGGAFELFQCRDRATARRTAEWCACTAELAVVDRTDGAERRREFADLDTSLRDRRERGDAHRDPGPPPSNMKSKLEARDGTITIATPAHGFQALIVIGMAFATGPFWLALLFRHVAVGDEPMEPAFAAGLYAIGGAPTLAIVVTLLFHALRRVTVQLGDGALRVREHGLRPRLVVMPADEVEEVLTADVGDRAMRFDSLLGGGPPVTVLSDRAQIAIGHTLKRAESDYLAEVLRGALSAEPVSGR